MGENKTPSPSGEAPPTSPPPHGGGEVWLIGFPVLVKGIAMATPFQRMKSAWDSADRQAELNRVVESMAAEGVTLEVLDEVLTVLLMEVRAAGADDDTEEIINCVSDRLHGWCHESGHIKTQAGATGHPSTAPADTTSPS